MDPVTPQQPQAPVLALVFDGLDFVWSGDAAGRLLRWPLRPEGLGPALLVSEGGPVAGLILHGPEVWALRPGRLEAYPALVRLPANAASPEVASKPPRKGARAKAAQASKAKPGPPSRRSKPAPLASSDAPGLVAPSPQPVPTSGSAPSGPTSGSAPSGPTSGSTPSGPTSGSTPSVSASGSTPSGPTLSAAKPGAASSPAPFSASAPLASSEQVTSSPQLLRWVAVPEGLDRLACRGGYLVAASDKQAAVFRASAEGWALARTVDLPPGTTEDLDVSWDGRHFLVVKQVPRKHPTLEVYSTADGSRAGGFEQKSLSKLGARFAPQAGYVYRGCRGNREVKLAKWTSGRGTVDLKVESAWNCPVEISPDGGFLFALLTGNAVQLFDLKAQHSILHIEPILDRSENRLFAGLSRAPVAFRPLGPGEFTISRWSRPPDAEVLYSSLALSTAGARIALGGADGSLTLLDSSSCLVQKAPHPVLQSSSPRTFVQDLHPDPASGQPASTPLPVSSVLASVPSLHPDPASGQPASTSTPPPVAASTSVQNLQPACSRVVRNASFRAMGRQGGQLMLLDHDGQLWLWPEAGAALPRLDIEPQPAEDLGRRHPLFWNADRIYLLETHRLRAFSPQTGAQLWEEPIAPASACWMPDGTVWTQHQGGELESLELGLDGTRRSKLQLQNVPGWGGPPIPAGPGRLLLQFRYAHRDEKATLLETATGRLTLLIDCIDACAGTDGRHFTICRVTNHDFQVWDGQNPESGPVLKWTQAKSPVGFVYSVTVSPKANRVAAYESRLRLMVWDLAGKPLAQLQGHGQKIDGLHISDDGRLLSWEYDGLFREWRLDHVQPPPWSQPGLPNDGGSPRMEEISRS